MSKPLQPAKKFLWANRWLTGAEYNYILQSIESYVHAFDFEILRDHPHYIYTAPKHGDIYFLIGESLRSLGFPRVKGLRKKFKWKKMNFTTPLPKQSPKVHYLVATGRLGNAVYRMHIASLSANVNDCCPLICHVLRIKTSKNSH